MQGFDLRHGQAVPVEVGLIDTAAGGVHVAVRLGANGDLVILPFQAGSQLVVKVRELLAERFAIAGEKLAGGER